MTIPVSSAPYPVRQRVGLKPSPNAVHLERAGGPGAGSPFLRASISERDWAEGGPMQGEARSSPSRSIKAKSGAKVQGSRPKPYDVKLEIKILQAADWQKLAKALSREAIFSAKLLAGEMPQDIEKAFKEAGLSLFPEKLKDLKTACSCPDWSNPCKHIAAVYYLLGEEFDRDPFLIFKLRGMNREDLVRILSGTGKKATQRKAKPKQEPLHEDEEALTSDVSKFWNGETLPDDFFGEVSIPSVPAALPKRLGSFPFWRGQERFLDAMESIYSRVSVVGLKVFLGEQISEEKI